MMMLSAAQFVANPSWLSGISIVVALFRDYIAGAVRKTDFAWRFSERQQPAWNAR